MGQNDNKRKSKMYRYVTLARNFSIVTKKKFSGSDIKVLRDKKKLDLRKNYWGQNLVRKYINIWER